MLGEIYNSLRSNLRDPEYAEGYAEEFLNAYIATQIKVIREQRNMTQAQLAEQIGTTQAGVSRYENVNYPSWSISGLKKVARALHVRLKVSFEPFGTLPGEVVNFNRNNLERAAREEDPGLAEIGSELASALLSANLRIDTPTAVFSVKSSTILAVGWGNFPPNQTGVSNLLQIPRPRDTLAAQELIWPNPQENSNPSVFIGIGD